MISAIREVMEGFCRSADRPEFFKLTDQNESNSTITGNDLIQHIVKKIMVEIGHGAALILLC